MRHLSTKLFWLIVAAALVGFIAYGFYPKPVAVDTTQPIRRSLEITIDDDGETQIREKYIVSAPVSGKMLRLQLEAGDHVKQDETELARIKASDPALLDARAKAESEARVRAAEAALEQAEAVVVRSLEALELADHHYSRAKTLVSQAAMSRADFDHAEHQQRIAKADVKSAEFSRRVAKHELEQARAALLYADSESDAGKMFSILSPINGQVLKVYLESASVVTAGMSLLEIGDPHDLEIKIDVLSTDAVRIRPGNKVYIEHWGGPQILNGIVRLVEPAAFLKISALGVEEKRVNVIVDFVDPWDQRATLGDGYRIEARIVVDATEADALIVPAGTLFRQGDLWYVYRIDDGIAKQCAVKIGRSNGLETEITSGIKDNDALILHPSEAIVTGTAVRAGT